MESAEDWFDFYLNELRDYYPDLGECREVVIDEAESSPCHPDLLVGKCIYERLGTDGQVYFRLIFSDQYDELCEHGHIPTEQPN